MLNLNIVRNYTYDCLPMPPCPCKPLQTKSVPTPPPNQQSPYFPEQQHLGSKVPHVPLGEISHLSTHTHTTNAVIRAPPRTAADPYPHVFKYMSFFTLCENLCLVRALPGGALEQAEFAGRRALYGSNLGGSGSRRLQQAAKQQEGGRRLGWGGRVGRTICLGFPRNSFTFCKQFLHIMRFSIKILARSPLFCPSPLTYA